MKLSVSQVETHHDGNKNIVSILYAFLKILHVSKGSYLTILTSKKKIHLTISYHRKTISAQRSIQWTLVTPFLRQVHYSASMEARIENRIPGRTPHRMEEDWFPFRLMPTPIYPTISFPSFSLFFLFKLGTPYLLFICTIYSFTSTKPVIINKLQWLAYSMRKTLRPLSIL